MGFSSTHLPWKPRQPVATVLSTVPSEAVSPSERVVPLRKPQGFVPAVQRWSMQLPHGESGFRVAFFGAQAADENALSQHPLHDWARRALQNHSHGPTAVDHARSRTSTGGFTHTITAYWIDEARYQAWSRDAELEAWWAVDRLTGPFGTWREILLVPRDRQETLYWLDFPIGLSSSDAVSLYPTPYCGYYGAMRDRLQAAAADMLEAAGDASLVAHPERLGYGEHWSVKPPHNLAVLRGGSSWGFMDAEQHADYDKQLRGPVTDGMDYLDQNALPSGCASMRWQVSTDADGDKAPDEHAHTYFLSLSHLESWSEHHGSHAAIFSAAIHRYRKYGQSNQLRTWHEVYVLPEGEQRFEYLNCHPQTGLLPWFEGRKIR